ncbi:hypothetical protein QJQ45_021736, partial [Haematococcus lacustris]
SSRARERELLGGLADADAKLATQASSLTLLQERLSSAQEGWRKAESESAQLQSRLLTSEQALKASGKEVAKLKEEVEAVRSATYLEVYRAEDELRAVKEELGARAARVAHLEHVLKAKDRDVARIKEEREASKAVERERAKVAEEVTIRIETELQACKQKAAQLESSLRTSQREARQLEEALRAARGAEGDVLIKSSKAEDGARRLESEVTNTKLRALQVEAQLKARERDVQQLSRTIEGVRSELYESDARAVRAEELVRHLEKEAAVARSRCLNSEGAVRVKERELERMARLLEAAKLADVTSSSRVSAAEDSSRRLEGELASARVKIAQLESGIKSREQQIDKLSKTLDGLRREEFDVVLQAAKSEDATRRLDGDLACLRARLSQADALVKAKGKEIERVTRAADAAKAAEYEAVAQRLQAEEAASRLEGELVGIRQRVLAMDAAGRAKEKEGWFTSNAIDPTVPPGLQAERLSKLLDMTKASEFQMSVKLAQAEAAGGSLADDLATAQKRCAQLESSVKAKDREVAALHRQITELQDAQAAAGLKVAKAEEGTRQANEEAAVLRQKLVQAATALETQERETAKVTRLLQAAKGSGYETESQRLASEEAARQLDEQLGTIKARVQQLEVAVRSKDREVDKLGKALEAAQAEGMAAARKVADAEETRQKLESEAGSLRARLAQADSSAKTHERQLERLERMLEGAKGEQLEAEGRRAAAEEATRVAAEEAAAARQARVQAEHAVRSRERELERVAKLLDGTKGSEVEASVRLARAEEAVQAVTEECREARTRATQLEATIKAKDKELERLAKVLSQARGSEYSTDAQRLQAEEAVRKLDAELAAVKSRASQLEHALRARDKDIDGLQRLLEAAKGAEFMAAAHRARAEDSTRQAEAEATASRQRVVQLESHLKARIRELEKAQRAVSDSGLDSDGQQARTEESLRALEAKLTGLRAHASQLQSALKARDKQVGPVLTGHGMMPSQP